MSNKTTYTADEKAEILAEFQDAGLSVPQFAKRAGVNPSTLRSWLKKTDIDASPKREDIPSTVTGGDEDPAPPPAVEYEEGEPVEFVRGPFPFAVPNAAYAYTEPGKMVRLVKGRRYVRPYSKELAAAAEKDKIRILGRPSK